MMIKDFEDALNLLEAQQFDTLMKYVEWKVNKRTEELEKVFLSVPQPSCLIEKWNNKKQIIFKENSELSNSLLKLLPLIGKEVKMKKCCNSCGFPIDMPREPVLINDNIISYLNYKDNECKECGHQRDGSTLPEVNKLIQSLCQKFMKEREQLIKFIKKYNDLNREERKEICVSLPDYSKQICMFDEESMIPYSWNVVYLEVINNTQLSKTMLAAIK